MASFLHSTTFSKSSSLQAGFFLCTDETNGNVPPWCIVILLIT
jgi:hypothetical protein